MTRAINGDLGLPVVVDTRSMAWSPSPSGSVWRKRLHLVGPPESGQVTSVVRYEAASTFPAHDHPDGEEILVLDGVFSDEHGDWRAGSFLLNPEGFRHAPFSREGCLLFVKLRQYPGRDRRHVALDVSGMPWQSTTAKGISIKTLYEQAGYSDSMRLERWGPDTPDEMRRYGLGAELFVIEGAFVDESGRHEAGSWMRFPVGASHHAGTREGCTMYVKEGGSAYLDSANGGGT
jgi:anti-sigma factor ChrR (cupin superfamily)